MLPPDHGGKEADEELFNVTNPSTSACNTSNESEYEVSDFLSSDDSCDEWLPWWLSLTFPFTLIKMTSVTNKIIFIINKDELF